MGSQKSRLSSLLLVFFVAELASAQAPQITPGGVVSAASYAQPISPGSAVSIFGINLAATEATASHTPLPTILAGTSVTVNGAKAPLFFVSPRQINLQVPSSLATSDLNYESSSIVVTTATGSTGTVQVPLYPSSPAIFTAGASGCGPAAATNDAEDGTVLLNSISNSAAPGDYVTIYGTGLGFAGSQPADGSHSTGPDALQIVPGVWIDGQLLPRLAYAGLAPTLVGVDQINLQIPLGTREGCAVPVAVQAGALISPTVSLSIHSGRGQCVDPPVQSYG